MEDVKKLRILADWLDLKHSEYKSNEVQIDLRKIANKLEKIKELQRYSIYPNYTNNDESNDVYSIIDKNGEWVKYEDLRKLLEYNE